MAHREDRNETRRRLCAALRGDRAPETAPHPVMLRLADEEGVAPLLRERTRSALPGGCAKAARLRDLALREAALELRRTAVLVDVLQALARAGVPVLVFKGTALAHSHYPRPELRPRDDTDLLVDRRHLEVAAGVLADVGFERVPGNEGELIMRQRLYRRSDADGVLHNLDLHWALSNTVHAPSFAPRALMARAGSEPGLGPHALVPGDGDALLIACLHLDAHHPGEVRLIWLYDVHLLVTAMDLESRVRTADAAVLTGLGAACAWVLWAANEAFDTPLHGFEILFESRPPRAPARMRTTIWLRELARLPDARTRVRWLAQHAFPPADFMRAGAVHGAPLWWLYLRRALRAAAHLSRR